MHDTTLGEFVDSHREEILRRWRAKNSTRPLPLTGSELERGIPRFLDDLVGELNGGSKTAEMGARATQHGADLFSDGGTTVGQVVHSYGAVCQSVTDLAVDTETSIRSEDFRTLNRCLDDAIAAAVTEYARQEIEGHDEQVFVKSMASRNLISTAINGFEALQSGNVGIGGSTGNLVYRSLLALRAHGDENDKAG